VALRRLEEHAIDLQNQMTGRQRQRRFTRRLSGCPFVLRRTSGYQNSRNNRGQRNATFFE
jgi:cob(I)alamin adenosyltransferase